MSKFESLCTSSLFLLTGMTMIIVVVLGVTKGVLSSLVVNLDSLWVLLMLYGGYPLYLLLLLWPKQKSRAECWVLMLGWVPFIGIMVFGWRMVLEAEAGAVPALVMIWYGLAQLVVVAILFILLALIRMWQSGRTEGIP